MKINLRINLIFDLPINLCVLAFSLKVEGCHLRYQKVYTDHLWHNPFIKEKCWVVGFLKLLIFYFCINCSIRNPYFSELVLKC